MADKESRSESSHDQTNEITQPTTERQKTFSRRALLEAGWSMPLIAAVQFPTDAFAVSVPAHEDSLGHADELTPKLRENVLAFRDQMERTRAHSPVRNHTRFLTGECDRPPDAHRRSNHR